MFDLDKESLEYKMFTSAREAINAIKGNDFSDIDIVIIFKVINTWYKKGIEVGSNK